VGKRIEDLFEELSFEEEISEEKVGLSNPKCPSDHEHTSRSERKYAHKPSRDTRN